MGVERLKSYRLVCDGEIMWRGYRAECYEKKVVQYPSKHDLMKALKAGSEGGWSADRSDEVRCPRSDHLED